MFPPTVASDRRLFAANADFAARVRTKVQAISEICENWHDSAGMLQGYTYLGQFLAHDIVSREVPGMPVSIRSRKLDLDSVYGSGARFDAEGRFLYTAASATHAKDLLRDASTRRACIPEFRNDQHVILAQLHLTVQLFHNAALDAIRVSAAGRGLGCDECFETARGYVVASLQRIYVEDYLSVCCDQAIYRLHRDGLLRVFELPASETDLPYEISHAALRFGHSQVRESYLLNRSEESTELGELFSLSGLLGGADFQGVPHRKAVDWRRFFDWGAASAGIVSDSGRRINPKVVEPMSALPEPPVASVIARNIEAGCRVQLPSGQAIAMHLGRMGIDRRIVPALQLQPRDAHQEFKLRAAGLWDESPLWLYVLLEASALGGDGLRLGPLGSVFLCETVRSALQGMPAYGAVQAHCREAFGLPRVASFVQLARFADPLTYGG